MGKNKKSSRRSFIVKAALSGAGIVLGKSVLANAETGTPEFPETVDANKRNFLPHDKRKLGSLEVSAIGLGCMSMAGIYNPPQPKDAMIAVIRKGYDQGVTFYDTAEVYGPFYSEEIVGEAVKPFRNKINIATKIGFSYNGTQVTGRNSKPDHVRKAVEGCLKRLQTDVIDLCYLHRADPNTPVEDVAGVMKELIQQGKIRNYGLSEVSPESIRKAHAVHPVAALQSKYSLLEQVMEHEVLKVCKELGIGFVPWGPVARGFLTGRFNLETKFDYRRADVSYLQKDNLAANMKLLELVKEWARKKAVTPAQFSLGWLLAQKPYIVPIPGTTNQDHLVENMGGLNTRFTDTELKEFESALSKVKLMGVREPGSVHQNL